MKKFDTSKIVYIGLLTAMEIVLNRFLSINAWNLKIGFSFVPVAVAGMLFGPLPAAAVGALGDFVGALVFPIGPYFPGFTVTAFLTGAVFGFFLKGKTTVPRVAAAVGINQLILSLLLNSLWISVLYGSPYLPLLSTRAIQCAVLIPVEIIMIPALGRVFAGLGDRVSAL
jgi:ECF transporter S component (folate family)